MAYGISKKKFPCYGIWLYDELIPLIGGHHKNRITFETTSGQFKVRVGASRLHCLKRSPTCVRCGLVGQMWVLEHTEGINVSPHLNLYAIMQTKKNQDALVLMTQDHIIPTVKGGHGMLSNLQTMCVKCNVWKADKTPDQIEDILGEPLKDRHEEKMERYFGV